MGESSRVVSGFRNAVGQGRSCAASLGARCQITNRAAAGKGRLMARPLSWQIMKLSQKIVPLVAALVACRGGTPKDTATNYHGTTVADPRRWLEDGSSPAVKRFIDQQNAHTDSVVSAFPEGAALAKR